MRNSVEVAFRIPKEQDRAADKLVEKGVFQNRSELFRQALRDLLQKFEKVTATAAG